MRTSWVVMLGIIYIIGTVISLGIQAQYPTDVGSPFYTIMSVDWASFSNPLGALTGFFTLIVGAVQAFVGILVWDYSFLVGEYMIFRYIGWVFSATMILILILSLVRGTSSS